MKKYHNENREKEKKYRRKNRQKIIDSSLKWREENHERFNSYQREYKKEHPLENLTQKRKIERRAERHFSLGLECELCPDDDKRTTDLQRHHPSYEGGMEAIFVTCCKSCHWYADRTTVEEKLYKEDL